jgi:outer membrane protein OmpA-like peptidoglycan-associated protein
MTKLTLPIVLATLVLTGCASGGLFGQSSMPLLQTGGAAYGQILAKEYSNLADLSSQFLSDEKLADHYMKKSAQSRRGKAVLPDNPSQYSLNTDQLHQTIKYYNMLLNALRDLASEENAALLAMAQTRFDCWLHATANNYPIETQEYCFTQLEQSLTQMTVPRGQGLNYRIVFNNAEAILSEGHVGTIEQAANAWQTQQHMGVLLIGYMPKISEANRHLAVRRGLAVRNYLAQYGIDPDRINIVARQVSADNKADGITAQDVEIRFQPNVLVTDGPFYESLEGLQ